MAAGLGRARRRAPAAARWPVDPRCGGALLGGTIDSCGDHRVAMAFAVAALRARTPIGFGTTPTWPRTSFPRFVATARAVGLGVEEARSDGNRSGCPDSAPPITSLSTARVARARHDQPWGRASRRLASARQRRAVPPGGAGRARCECGERGPAPARRAHGCPGSAPAGRWRARHELDGQDVTGADPAPGEPAGPGASRVAAWPGVRAALLERQGPSRAAPRLVADGWDMALSSSRGGPEENGLTATPRRGPCAAISQLKDKRVPMLAFAPFARDSRAGLEGIRPVRSPPLRPAPDACVIDSTGLDVGAWWGRCRTHRCCVACGTEAARHGLRVIQGVGTRRRECLVFIWAAG